MDIIECHVSSPTTQFYKLHEELLVMSPGQNHPFLLPRFKASVIYVYNLKLALGTVTSTVK